MLFDFKRIKRRISARRGRMGRATLAQSPDAELTSTMKQYDNQRFDGSGSTDADRQPTDDRPPLSCELIHDDGTEFAIFYETEERGYGGEVIVAEPADVVEVPGR